MEEQLTLKLHTNTTGSHFSHWQACISVSLCCSHCASRCTELIKGCRPQLSLCCKSGCGTKTPVWVKLLLPTPLLSSSQAELRSNSQPFSLAHCLLPTQQPCEHLCEHSSVLPQPHVFKLSPSLSCSTSVLFPYLPLCLPCGDICCCLHGTLALGQTSPPSSWPPPQF